ncbi:MAG: hypothetical protein ACREQ5_08550 [Candidatus Dormibacteria bacterium]
MGDSICKECHQAEAELFPQTGHHLTSRLADKDSILGNFTKGFNVVRTSNPMLFYQMTSDGQAYFQRAVMGIPPDTTSRTEQFAIIIGSGKRGQTYLYWKGAQLFELPVSYWTDLHAWVNSPGYPDGMARFDRPIIPRCLTCHTVQSCGVFRERGNDIATGCIGCHMPARDSNVLFSTTDGRKARVKMHNHWIKIYPPPQKQ